MKYLVIEYKESCNGALYNRNDYETGLVQKFAIEENPFVMAEKYGLSKLQIRKDVEREVAKEIFDLKADAMSSERELKKVQAKLYLQETIHSADKEFSKWCRPNFYGYRATIDNTFVSCKKCLKKIKLKEIRDSKDQFLVRPPVDPLTGTTEATI